LQAEIDGIGVHTRYACWTFTRLHDLSSVCFSSSLRSKSLCIAADCWTHGGRTSRSRSAQCASRSMQVLRAWNWTNEWLTFGLKGKLEPATMTSLSHQMPTSACWSLRPASKCRVPWAQPS